MSLTDPDLSIWQKAQRGEQSAYDLLRRKYRPLVRGEVRKRLSGISFDDLEDIEQSVWLAAWRALPGFRGLSLFSTWLAAIAKNVVFEWIRRRRSNQQVVSLATAEALPDPSASLECELADRLSMLDAMRRLSDPEREAIYFCVVQQLTHEEAAARLGAPLGTLKSRVRAGLKKLQKTIALEMTMGQGGRDE